jgi:hypothetical protein
MRLTATSLRVTGDRENSRQASQMPSAESFVFLLDGRQVFLIDGRALVKTEEQVIPPQLLRLNDGNTVILDDGAILMLTS